MKKSIYHLTTLDLKNISSQMGRIPTDIEIEFIENVLLEKLQNRAYLQVLDRLNSGAKRRETNKIDSDDNNTLHINSGLKIFDKNSKVVLNKDETNYINNVNGLQSLSHSLNMYDSKIQLAEKSIIKKSRIVNNEVFGKYQFDQENTIIFSTSIGIKTKEAEKLFPQTINYNVFKIEFGNKSIRKHIIHMTYCLNELNTENWFVLSKAINWQGLGRTIIDLVNTYNIGIKIVKSDDNNSISPFIEHNEKLSIICIVQNSNISDLKKYGINNNLIVEEIGVLCNDQNFQINTNKETLVNLPNTVFDLPFNANTQHFKQFPVENTKIKQLNNKLSKTSYTNQLLKLYSKINEEDILLDVFSKKKILEIINGQYGKTILSKTLNRKLILTQADNFNLTETAPRLCGRIAIANALRKLSCMGVKPTFVAIHNLFPLIDDKNIWVASELLQGQEEAIREMEIDIGSRKIDSFGNLWYQNISGFGYNQNDSVEMDISFKQGSDFITLLGSHRGELGGSAYEKYINSNSTNALPSVDLRMENRLQDVVQQGIFTKLIKSASNVGAGGIAIAIAKAVVASGPGLGARIHLSRKLKSDELLFGETQGLVVVTLDEEDIMEFERICMTVGVPSTTIGRVTNTNTFSFNDLISLNVDKIRDI